MAQPLLPCLPPQHRPRCRALDSRQQLRRQAAAHCSGTGDAPADDDYEAALDDREVSAEVAVHLRSVRENLGVAVRGALVAPQRPDRSLKVRPPCRVPTLHKVYATGSARTLPHTCAMVRENLGRAAMCAAHSWRRSNQTLCKGCKTHASPA